MSTLHRSQYLIFQKFFWSLLYNTCKCNHTNFLGSIWKFVCKVSNFLIHPSPYKYAFCPVNFIYFKLIRLLISVHYNNINNVSGKPTPTVMWYRGDEVLTNRTTVAPASQGGIVRSQVVLVDLGREDLHSELTCRAWNNNKTAPLSSTVHVDMNCEFPN